ncbi:MAG: hypothetical protein EAZ85_00715 [Bacteroidetes bacterium]|nr:MAG: hypothetical protein EAZ85_00715 [Bacteroidota bacterium]TAG87648.1 MAG: hypothetical protein EAZ20_10185 [Bacteroidota bacterium]
MKINTFYSQISIYNYKITPSTYMNLKFLLLFIFFIFINNIVFSQTQKRYFTEQEAKIVKSYLDYESDVIVFCLTNPLADDLLRLVEIEKVSIQKSEDYPDKYEVVLKGAAIGVFKIENLLPKNYNSVIIPYDEVIDLSYIYVRHNGGQDFKGKKIWLALCLATILGHEVEADLEPFDYPIPDTRGQKE